MQQYFVTGIGTDVGKTVVSAILAQALHATYWKPAQAGDLHALDSVKVNALTDDKVQIYPEKFLLNTPASPHYAAAIDGIDIQITDFELPTIDGNLIIEGAGGVLVPINEAGDTYLDIMFQLQLPIILVSRHYLGSINHTLLSVEAIKQKGLTLVGIVFVGDENQATESIILKKTGLKQIARIPIASELTKEFIQEQANLIQL